MEKRKPSSKEEAIARAKCKDYLNRNKNQGPNINKEILAKRNSKIIRGNEVYAIEDYADDLITLFKNNNIPPYRNLFDVAFARIARRNPVFPLKQNDLSIDTKTI